MIYNSNEDFHVGQAKVRLLRQCGGKYEMSTLVTVMTEGWYRSLCQVVYQSKDDQVTVVAAGVALHEALTAAEHLKKGTVHCVR